MISEKAKVIWAKKSHLDQDNQWLPLVIHMADAAEISRILWHQWVPEGTKRRIASGICKEQMDYFDLEDKALSCFIFLSAIHDLGKATPAFQGKLGKKEIDEYLLNQLNEAGLFIPDNTHPFKARHYWASQVILENFLFSRNLAVIVGGHHGKPPNRKELRDLCLAYKKDLGWEKGQDAWRQVQKDLLDYALELAGLSEQEAKTFEPDIAAQVLLSGLVIIVDWIVSNEDLFEYVDSIRIIKSYYERIEKAWDKLSLPECWIPGNAWENLGNEYFKKRFEIEKPRPVQVAVVDILKDVTNPGIVIIEAPMGEGKTEAALAAAELLAYRTKRSGVFFALPTQASANGLFMRVCSWIARLEDGVDHSVYLAHGKADLNELYSKMRKATEEIGCYWVGGATEEDTDEDAIIVHDWLSGRKKGILADFVIGTIDQVLMGGLKQKHLALRHLGLANKVIILDECHAYDAYMSQYLYKVLNWLGAYNVQVVVLSATLPGDKRKQLIDAYLNKDYPQFDVVEESILPDWATTYDYPIITYTSNNMVFQKNVNASRRNQYVEVNKIKTDEEIIPLLEKLLSEGGCAGIIVNTVKRAQRITGELRKIFGEENVLLLHSHFIAVDRAIKEKELFEKLGAKGKRPDKCIVVGTQVFEQSCDIDFDVLITDICPMDLLIQRIGRLHRHLRKRPTQLLKPQCFVIVDKLNEFDVGSELIYGKYLLMNTFSLLPSQMKLPDDIPKLVQKTYDDKGVLISPELQEEYKNAKAKQKRILDDKISRAEDFQISSPYKRSSNLIGWLDSLVKDDPSGKRGEATVRDIENTIEVLVVQKKNKELFILPWHPKFGGQKVPNDMPPPVDLARAIAECSIQLPRELCWQIDNTISELERISLLELWAWQQSPWLKGELFLVLDKDLSAELCGYRLQYDKFYGLLLRKISEEDVNE